MDYEIYTKEKMLRRDGYYYADGCGDMTPYELYEYIYNKNGSVYINWNNFEPYFSGHTIRYNDLEELYDKYIKMELEEYDSVFERIDEKNTKIVINSIRKALKDSLKDEYFTKTTDTVNNEKVDKTTLVLNKTNCENIKKDFINALLADEEFLNSASTLSEQEVSEIKNSLTDTLEEKLDESYEPIDISIYTNNTEFVKFEIIDANNNITVVKNEENYDYEVKLEDEEPIKGTVTLNPPAPKAFKPSTACCNSLSSTQNGK